MKFLRVVVMLLGGAMALPLPAAEAWYQVELIVLAQRKPEPDSVTASAVVAPPAATGTVLTIPDPAQPVTQNARIAPVAPGNLRLSAEARRITANSNYELLVHTAWRQPALSSSQALPVRIRSGVSLDNEGVAIPRLDGTVQLSVGRFLQFDTNLRYHAVSPQTAGEPPPPAADTPIQLLYRLNESRRMRSRELHYLDHPMFGVIVLVTPL